MSFERHHPNRKVEHNLAKVRDLRSAYLFACLATIAEFMTRAWRTRRRGSVSPRLDCRLRPIAEQPV